MNLLSEQDIALAWIGVNDPIALGGNFKDSEHVKNFAANLEAAILAKLASAELPEPSILKDEELGDFSMTENHYTETSLLLIRAQAHAQGFAAGAAAQLAEKLRAERDALQSQLDAMGKGEPVASVDHNCEPHKINWEVNPLELADGVSLYAAPKALAPDVDWLSNVIRQVDGNNKLGAGALAEKIVEAIFTHGIGGTP